MMSLVPLNTGASSQTATTPSTLVTDGRRSACARCHRPDLLTLSSGRLATSSTPWRSQSRVRPALSKYHRCGEGNPTCHNRWNADRIPSRWHAIASR
jgi:hypothetical protein